MLTNFQTLKRYNDYFQRNSNFFFFLKSLMNFQLKQPTIVNAAKHLIKALKLKCHFFFVSINHELLGSVVQVAIVSGSF